MMDFFFDFETRSRLDLKEVGTIRYALHESTEATLITYAFGKYGELRYWRLGWPLPQDLIEVARNPENFNFIAFNVIFDYMIWMHAFIGKMGGIVNKIPLERVHDCMALTCHYRAGSSLGSAAKMFDLPLEKDKEGRRIMLKQRKPDRKGKFPELTAEEWQHFIRYGLLDTRILREIYYRCPALPSGERWVWEWTFRRNLQGIRVDVPLINVLNDILSEEYPKYLRQFHYFTGGNFTVKSTQKCLEFFKQFWPSIKNMRKDTVRDMLLESEGKPNHAVQALKIKETAGSNSLAKIKVAVNQTFKGRLYNLLVYHKAQTKRWAGYGVQIQNMPRLERLEGEPKINLDAVNVAEQLLEVRSQLKQPLKYIKNLIRRWWIPQDGNRFYCGDYSKIEPTFLRWLAGMGEIPPLVYEEMAEAIYNIPIDQIGKDSEERQVGKAVELGGGYGMGWRKFRADVYEKTGIVLTPEMAKHVIKVYRKKNKPIVDLWNALDAAFRRAIYGETSVVCDGKIAVGPMQGRRGVQIRLPSGGRLYYHGAFIRGEEEIMETITIRNGVPHIEKKKVWRDNVYYVGDDQGSVKNIKVYGGQLTEHVTSAISREALAPAMWRVEQAGFEVLCCVHDEMWAESYHGRDQEFDDLMAHRPTWARDVVIKVGLDNGLRYLK